MNYLKRLGKISLLAILSCYLLICCCPLRATAQADSIPAAHKKRWFSSFTRYVDSMMNRRFRDSVLKDISRHNDPPPVADDGRMTRSEQGFLPHNGRTVRRIHFRKVKVFGPRNINDTAFTTSMKLIHLANKLHFDSQEWAIRQMLFFRENDTVNAYAFADNERYLRNRPFLQDARIVTLETASQDTVDVLVITKDVFEYGFDLRELAPSGVGARISNDNLFGAAQGVQFGFRWKSSYSRPWGTEARYTKYNLLGSFIDVSVGYTHLNTNSQLDTGVYEGSYYIKLDRPLYRSSAKITGGLSLARNFSIRVWGEPDSLWRNYAYKLVDVWSGWNFRNRFGSDGHFDNKPNVALLFRYSNIAFDEKPNQEKYVNDPLYNDRHYYLGQLAVFKQDFFKSHRFFGFGRTEDIPYGYSAALSVGRENWMDRRRLYTGIEGQKYWPTLHNGLLSVNVGVGGFWQGSTSEDLVIHTNVSYFSRLMQMGKKWNWREFVYIDYLGTPNNYFYRPLSLNRDFGYGFWGWRRTKINGYHRLLVRSESVLYSPWKVYGFKFNFVGTVEAGQVSYQNHYLLKNPVYTGLGLAVRIKNENLSLNTLQLSAAYYPRKTEGIGNLFFEITTIVDFRFDIYGLKAPAFLRFQ